MNFLSIERRVEKFWWRVWNSPLLSSLVVVSSVLIPAGIILAVIIFDAVSRPPLEKSLEERVHDLLMANHPTSIEDWTCSESGDAWTLGLVSYFDDNRDGKPDRKFVFIGTESGTLCDVNFDGKFDTEIRLGCFGGPREYWLIEKIPVPTRTTPNGQKKTKPSDSGK